jgi:endonuclease-3
MSQLKKNRRAAEILKKLAEHYPDATTALNFSNEFELLVSVVLSAQSTDKQVNQVTRELFQKYRTPEDFAVLTPEELAEEIKGCGLYRNKAVFLVQIARQLVSDYNSRVPANRQQLEALPGVGRKTANVVLSLAFGQDTLAVDTHVHRVAARLGLASGKNTLQTEKELLDVIPLLQRKDFHHRLITHGRKLCKARKPLCSSCFLSDLCPSNPLQPPGCVF